MSTEVEKAHELITGIRMLIEKGKANLERQRAIINMLLKTFDEYDGLQKNLPTSLTGTNLAPRSAQLWSTSKALSANAGHRPPEHFENSAPAQFD